MKHVTNYLAVATGLFTVVLSQSAYANGTPITDPSIVVPTLSAYSGTIVGALEINSMVNDSVNPGPTGLMGSEVLANDPDNPFSGAGGLTFVYQMEVYSSSPTFLDIFSSTTVWPTTSGMTVGYQGLAGDIDPSFVSRIAGVLTWTFLTQVNPGEYTDDLIVDSSVTSFSNPYWSVQDGGQSEARAYAPGGVPDGGTTMTLLGGALLAISALRRKLS